MSIICHFPAGDACKWCRMDVRHAHQWRNPYPTWYGPIGGVMTADELHVALDAMYELRKNIKNGVAAPWKDYVGVQSLSDETSYKAAMHRAKVTLEDMLTEARR